ncbi:MAG: T9SS type A sorting domain-containing protein [Rhodothermales bacterium]
MKMWVRGWILGVAVILSVALPASAQSLVKDINTLTSGPRPHDLVSTGTQAFFTSGGGLWVVDEAGIHMRRVFKDWPGNLRGFAPDQWAGAALNGKLLFRLQGSATGFSQSPYFEDLWVSDGTPDGTFSLTDVKSRYRIGHSIALGNHVYFLKHLADGYRNSVSELWITNGTKVGTELLASFRASDEGIVESLHEFDGALWFVTKRYGESRYPVQYDLVQFDTVSHESTTTGFTSSTYMDITGISESKLFLFVGEDDGGLELWAMDKDSRDPQRVHAFPDDTYVSTYATWGIATTSSHFLFKSSNSRHFSDLYASDGTPEGTHLLTNKMGGWSTWNPGRKSGVVGNRALFQAPDSTHSERIWTTDGTVEGTEILTWPESGDPFDVTDGFTVFRDEVFFAAWQRATGWELWATDGTPGGTRLAADFRPGPESGSVDPVVATNSGVLGTALDLSGNPRLWYSSGIPGKERTVPYVTDYARNNSSHPQRFRRFGNTVYFTAGTEETGRDLWKTDGTPSDTDLLFPPVPDGLSSNATAIGSIRDHLFIATDDSLYSLSLESGRITNLSLPGRGPFHPSRLRQNRMYFNDSSPYGLLFALDEHGNPELWTSDGTVDGTRKVSAFGTPSTRNPDFSPYHDYLDRVMGTVDGRHVVLKYAPEGRFVYSIDPLTGSMEMLLDPSLTFGSAHMVQGHNTHLLHYYRSPSNHFFTTDGTTSGTKKVELTGGPGLPESIQEVHQHQNGLLFTATTSDTGRELWYSDGTPEGTRILRDICPGACGSVPQAFVSVGEHTFFKVYSEGDDHVWVTDGTTEGTVPVITERTPEGERDVEVLRMFPTDSGVLVMMRMGVRNNQIWYTDESKGSGRLLSDGFDDGYEFSGDVQHGAVLGHQFIFAAEHPIYGDELFKLDLPGRATSVATESTVPTGIGIEPGYPNPFSKQLTVSFDLPTAMEIRIEVFDMLGRRVWTEEATRLPAGRHTTVLQLGPELASGVYHIRVRADSHVRTIRAVKAD